MADFSQISRAAQLLKDGGLVAFPTETVYGLGANALSNDAVASIYKAKGRPDFNPLIVHFHSILQAEEQVHFHPAARTLAQRFWPGPLTMVLKRKQSSGLSLLVSAGMDTVGVRIPAHPIARVLLKEIGLPIAAPSANRSGRVSPTHASHVAEELGNDVGMIIDGGPCNVGIESTVLDFTDAAKPVLLRPGSITREALSEVLGQTVLHASRADTQIKSPGMLESHYAPSLPVRLNAISVWRGEALLAFGSKVPSGALRVMNLSESGDLTEAAAHLFAYLRELDNPAYSGIAVMPIPEERLGVAINDRLKRAAAKR